MPWPWVWLPQKIRHSVGLSRITDKLVPSNDWKKSFNRSSTHTWGSRDRLSRAVKIRTSRLYFSTSALLQQLWQWLAMWPETPRWGRQPGRPCQCHPMLQGEDRGGPTLAGSSFVALDLPGIFGICIQVRRWCYKSGRTLWVWASPVAALWYCVEQLKEWRQLMMHLWHGASITWAGTHLVDQGKL